MNLMIKRASYLLLPLAVFTSCGSRTTGDGVAGSIPTAAGAPPNTDAKAATADSPSEVIALLDRVYDLIPYGPDGNRARHEIKERLLGACMAKAGFDLEPIPYVTYEDTVSRASIAFPPLPSAAEVEHLGYRAFTPAAAEPAGAAAATEVASARQGRLIADPVFAKAYFGDDPNAVGGCLGETEDTIDAAVGTTSVDIWSTIGDEFADALSTTNDATIATLDKEWATCMATKGFANLPDPGSTMSAFPPGDSAPGADEVRTALADLACRDSVSYRSRTLQGIRTKVVTWQERHASEIAALQTALASEAASLEAL